MVSPRTIWLLPALVLLALPACTDSSEQARTPAPQGTAPASPAIASNLVSPQQASTLDTVTCAPEEATERTITIGHLTLQLPAWWDDVEPLEAVPDEAISDEEVLDYQERQGDPKKATYRESLKMWVEIGTRTSGRVAIAWAGHSLLAGKEFAAAGCVWTASFVHNTAEPDATEADFNLVYAAYKAGEAYQNAGEGPLTTGWLELATTNPGGSSDGQFYADQAKELLS